MYSAIDDTIVAVSSAPGHAARGIVRLSGPEALAIAARLFHAEQNGSLAGAAGFTAWTGALVFDDRRHAPAQAYVFRAPRSYTRQDTVELHTFGAPPLLEMIVERCVAAGARPAEPGEFTARAFLAGAMNLPQAEAVAAVIQARSDAQLRAARRMLRGDLHERIRAWSEALAELLALVVADIDFAEEPIDFIAPAELARRLAEVREGIAGLVTATERAARLDVLPHVLLLGAPNAGKSTLFNRLTGVDRAIASAISGATRDILAEPVRIGPREVMLLDAAGVDDNPDEIVRHARARAVDAAAHVDLVCLVVDGTAGVERGAVKQLAALAGAATVIAASKCDLLDAATAQRRISELAACECGPVVGVSGTTGDGCAELGALWGRQLCGEASTAAGAALMLSARQRGALKEAAAALDRAADVAAGAADTLDVAELVAVELREGLDALGSLTGTVTTEDLLSRVFASFCIGK